jgi:hypothetical protein
MARNQPQHHDIEIRRLAEAHAAEAVGRLAAKQT